MSRPQIWNIEPETDREKEKVGVRPAKLNEKNGDRDLERQVKKRRDIFLFEEQDENFVAAVTNEKCQRPPIKCKVKMNGSENK